MKALKQLARIAAKFRGDIYYEIKKNYICSSGGCNNAVADHIGKRGDDV
jgi:hypothetical protein